MVVCLDLLLGRVHWDTRVQPIRHARRGASESDGGGARIADFFLQSLQYTMVTTFTNLSSPELIYPSLGSFVVSASSSDYVGVVKYLQRGSWKSIVGEARVRPKTPWRWHGSRGTRQLLGPS